MMPRTSKSRTTAAAWRAGGALLASVLVLAACGGGGGGGGAEFRDPPSALSQDTTPAGARVDRRADNFFPMAAGDTWTYDLTESGATTANALTRTVLTGPDASGLVTVSESAFGQSINAQYRRAAQGIWAVDPIGDAAPQSVRQFVGDLLEIPEPFYAAGGVLESIRQGSWDADLDGDGHPEGYRLEFRRQLVGFETMTLPRGSAQTVHLRTVIVFTIYPSVAGQRDVSSTATEDSWWAPGIGLVRAERRVDGDGAEPPFTLTIASGTVGGQPLFTDPPDGTLTKLSLVHNDLAYDAGRNRYYASIPGSVAGVGNSVATIHAATGAITYSAAVGSEPFALGLAPDGSALYVGLNGSGEVARLSLPSLVETGRVRLPNDTIFGAQMLAENIAVSPSDASVAAVSMWRPGLSPRHGGVALLRNLVLQPVKTQDHTGSNLIAFDAGGQVVYGFNNETTEFGLRRNLVQADGLVQGQVVAANGNFGTMGLESSQRGVMLGSTLYRGSDLAQIGQVSAPGGGCRWLAGVDRFVCFQSTFVTGEQRLVVADAGTFVTLSTPKFAAAQPQALPAVIIPGPTGQVALRMGNTYWNSPASEIWLFNSPALQ